MNAEFLELLLGFFFIILSYFSLSDSAWLEEENKALVLKTENVLNSTRKILTQEDSQHAPITE